MPRGAQGFLFSMSTPATSPPTLLAGLRALPRPVWILCAGIFINRFGTFVMPFLALYLTGRGYTAGDAALALGAFGLGHLGAAVAGGHLADHLGRRNTIVLSMLSTGVAMLLLSQAENLWAIVALAALTGVTGEMSRPAASALLTDLVEPDQRMLAFALSRVAVNAGWAFGHAATSIGFGLVALIALPHGIRTKPTATPWPGVWKVLRGDRAFALYIAATFAVAIVFQQMGSTFSLQVTGLGFSAVTYGLLISLNGVLVVLFELPLTMWVKRLPVRRAMAAGYVLVGAGFACAGFARSVPELALAMTVFTFGEMISMPASGTYLASIAPVHARGRYMGIFGLAWAGATLLGPAGGVALFGIHPLLVWLGCGALGLLAAGLVLIEGRAARLSPATA
jgi:MFS family permease